MASTNDRFWAKVLFKEFIRHYRKLSAEQKAADIDASMDALEDLDASGDSFGSKMVQWSMQRADQYPQAAANGSKGGRPRKAISTTAAGESAEKLDPPNIGGSAASAGRAPRSPRAGEVIDSPKVSETPTTAELYDFAEAARLNEADAREWWELCTERGWKDRSGKPIRNWKAACERYCAKRAANRLAAATRVE